MKKLLIALMIVGSVGCSDKTTASIGTVPLPAETAIDVQFNKIIEESKKPEPEGPAYLHADDLGEDVDLRDIEDEDLSQPPKAGVDYRQQLIDQCTENNSIISDKEWREAAIEACIGD